MVLECNIFGISYNNCDRTEFKREKEETRIQKIAKSFMQRFFIYFKFATCTSIYAFNTNSIKLVHLFNNAHTNEPLAYLNKLEYKNQSKTDLFSVLLYVCAISLLLFFFLFWPSVTFFLAWLHETGFLSEGWVHAMHFGLGYIYSQLKFYF